MRWTENLQPDLEPDNFLQGTPNGAESRGVRSVRSKRASEYDPCYVCVALTFKFPPIIFKKKIHFCAPWSTDLYVARFFSKVNRCIPLLSVPPIITMRVTIHACLVLSVLGRKKGKFNIYSVFSLLSELLYIVCFIL